MHTRESVGKGLGIGDDVRSLLVEEHEPLAGFVEDRLALIEDLGVFLDSACHGFFGGVAVELFVDGGHAFVEVGDLCLQFFQALYDEFVVHGLMGLGHKEGADFNESITDRLW